MAGESEIKLGIKAFADIDAAVKAYSELERKNESLEAKLKSSSKESQKSKSQEIDMIKRWQQANNEAMAAQVANAKKVEKLAQERQQRLDPNRIDAAIKLSQIRKSEMAAAERRNVIPEPTLWDQATQGATGYLTKMFAIGTAVNLISNAIGAVVTRNKEWADSIGDLDKKMDEARAKIGGLIGGDEKQSGRAMEHSIDIAMGLPAAASVKEVSEVQRRIASAGLDKKLGPLLEEQTHRLNILTQNYGEGSSAIGGADMLLKAINALPAGTEITPEVVRDLVTEIGNTFAKSTAEQPELFRFFQESQLLRSMGTNRKEDLALFSMAQTGLGAERTGTGMKRFVEAFNVVEEGSKEAGLLSQLGYGRNDLHLSKTGSALASTRMLESRMKEKGWDAVRRDEFRKVFFGQEASPLAAFALENEAGITQRAGELGDYGAAEKVRRDYLKTDQALRSRQALEAGKLRIREADRAGITFEDIERTTKLVYDRQRAEAGGDIITRNTISAAQAGVETMINAAKASGISPEAITGQLSNEIVSELRKQTGFMEAEKKRAPRRQQVESADYGLGSW